MKPLPIASGFRAEPVTPCFASHIVTADALQQVHEPLKWKLQLGERAQPHVVANVVRKGLVGARSVNDCPSFLQPHQIEAYARVLSTIRVYGGALLCDNVGLGKTYVSLAIAKNFERTLVTAPAAIVHQWRMVSKKIGQGVRIMTHDAFSRGMVPRDRFDLIVVDEAHRFRNPKTKRYQNLSRSIASADVLLVTATPVVNGANDLLHLLRLFLPDHGLALHGMPSLETALRHGTRSPVLKQVSPLMTARNSDVAGISGSIMPRSTDAPVEACAPLQEAMMSAVLQAFDDLAFPAFTHREEACHLLRSHLLYRLHSSVAAVATTLRRHRTYLHRALDAARCGQPLSRSEARRLFDVEDGQLDIESLIVDTNNEASDPTSFQAELQRIDSLMGMLCVAARNPSPKMERLVCYLNTRLGKKTIVFVNAVPTANAIARRLGWSRLVMVTSGQARIASGTLPLVDALQLFAPRANGIPLPPTRLSTDILIATDVLSEGVNLQDADVVVHYDLPWTSLRLHQRVGRIRRLGTQFREIDVRWFVPPPAIEQRLGLCKRISAKLQYQLQLGVPASSAVGRAKVTNRALDKREQIINGIEDRPTNTPRFAVVRGPLVAVYAIRWTLTSGTTRDVVVAAGHGEILHDMERICDMLERLFQSPASRRYPSRVLQHRCEETIRRRLAGAIRGPTSHQARKLGRKIIKLARTESAARRFDNLGVLDGVLQTVLVGTPVGTESQLRDILDGSCDLDQLAAWTRNSKRKHRDVLDVCVEAVLFGDGCEV